MEFDKHKPIFEQIAEVICKKIIDGSYVEGERIPSMRELASTIGVNPNTVVAAYNLLAEKKIIQTQRGIGYSAAAGSRKIAVKYMEEVLMNEELTRVFKELKRLNVTEEQIVSFFRKIKP